MGGRSVEAKNCLPEIIEKEIFNSLEEYIRKLKTDIENHFKALSDKISKGKSRISRLITDSIEDSKSDCLEKIECANKEGKEIVKKIIKHKNTKTIPMTDVLMLSGMRRSLSKIPPSNARNKKKTPHTKDQDCIAFESILQFLEEKK